MRCSSFAGIRALCAEAGLPSVAAIAKVVGIGLLVSGCASSQAAYDRPSHVGARHHQQVAVIGPPKVEIEDDGTAVQAPPVIRKRAEPDDPSEPFSPNYGPAPETDQPASAPQRRAEAPMLTIRSRLTPITEREAQHIIARAMVAHELRNP